MEELQSCNCNARIALRLPAYGKGIYRLILVWHTLNQRTRRNDFFIWHARATDIMQTCSWRHCSWPQAQAHSSCWSRWRKASATNLPWAVSPMPL